MNNLKFSRIGVIPAGHGIAGNLMMRNIIRSSASTISRDFVAVAVPIRDPGCYPEITLIPPAMKNEELSSVLSGLYNNGLSAGIQWHDGIAQHLGNFFTMNGLNFDIAGDFVSCCLRPRAATQRGIINVLMPSSQLREAQLFAGPANKVDAWETFSVSSGNEAVTHTLFQFGIQADLFGTNYMAPFQQSGIRPEIS